MQGLALGGEYGGAATYVAEHAPKGRRGFYTAWIQTTATLGLFMAIIVILVIRTQMGEEAFADWGWRIPFLLSAILLAVSIWIRLSLAKSPMFQKMKDEGTRSKAPLKEAFGNWQQRQDRVPRPFRRDRRRGGDLVWRAVLRACSSCTQTLKVPPVDANIMIAVSLLIGTPFFIFFGWLSDKIGRKPVMLAGFAIAALTYFWIFQGITHFANPALERALASSPVTVVADPTECSLPAEAHQHREIRDVLRHREVDARHQIGELRQ